MEQRRNLGESMVGLLFSVLFVDSYVHRDRWKDLIWFRLGQVWFGLGSV